MKKASAEKESSSLAGWGGCPGAFSDPWMHSEIRADCPQILFPGEGEEAEDEEQRGPELKQASRRDMYTICQSAGLGKNHLLCHLGMEALNKETVSIIP